MPLFNACLCSFDEKCLPYNRIVNFCLFDIKKIEEYHSRSVSIWNKMAKWGHKIMIFGFFWSCYYSLASLAMEKKTQIVIPEVTDHIIKWWPWLSFACICGFLQCFWCVSEFCLTRRKHWPLHQHARCMSSCGNSPAIKNNAALYCLMHPKCWAIPILLLNTDKSEVA